MLDIVQRQRLALDGDQLFTPGAVFEQAGRDIDVADTGEGIVIEHRADGQRVVEVDPEGQLLRPVELADRRRRESIDVAFERLPVGGANLGIAHAHDPVGAAAKIATKKIIPDGMVDREAGTLLMGKPPRPQFRLGCGRCRGRCQQERGHQRNCTTPEQEIQLCHP